MIGYIGCMAIYCSLGRYERRRVGELHILRAVAQVIAAQWHDVPPRRLSPAPRARRGHGRAPRPGPHAGAARGGRRGRRRLAAAQTAGHAGAEREARGDLRRCLRPAHVPRPGNLPENH